MARTHQKRNNHKSRANHRSRVSGAGADRHLTPSDHSWADDRWKGIVLHQLDDTEVSTVFTDTVGPLYLDLAGQPGSIRRAVVTAADSRDRPLVPVVAFKRGDTVSYAYHIQPEELAESPRIALAFHPYIPAIRTLAALANTLEDKTTSQDHPTNDNVVACIMAARTNKRVSAWELSFDYTALTYSIGFAPHSVFTALFTQAIQEQGLLRGYL